MDSIEKPAVDATYLLQKFPGKGGWTYVLIPEIQPDKKTYFNWVTVSGSIDHYPLNRIKLMPFGNGQLFLPVKAAIRKIIGKEAGDPVHIILSRSLAPLSVPVEILECFACEDAALLDRFSRLPERERRNYLSWIYEAKTDKGKVDRIAQMMQQLSDRLAG